MKQLITIVVTLTYVSTTSPSTAAGPTSDLLHCIAEDAVDWDTGRFERGGEAESWRQVVGEFLFDLSDGSFRTINMVTREPGGARHFVVSGSLGANDDVFASDGRTRIQIRQWLDPQPFLYAAPTYLWTGFCKPAAIQGSTR